MILVTGATGNVGSAVCAELVARGADVRAFVRDCAKAEQRLPSAVDVVVGDFADRESVARALEGTDVVFLSSADGPGKVAHESAVVDLARGRRIVKCSTVSASAGSALPPFDWNGRIEDHLRASGTPFVILQSAFYMTNLLASADAIRQTRKLFAPAAGAKVAMIDPRDTGAVGAVLCGTDANDGRTIEVTGPEAITFDGVARALSAATGNPVEFVDVPDEAARQTLAGAGMPDWLVSHLSALFPLLRSGLLDQPNDTVRELTGRDPRSIEEFARDFAMFFR